MSSQLVVIGSASVPWSADKKVVVLYITEAEYLSLHNDIMEIPLVCRLTESIPVIPGSWIHTPNHVDN